MNDRSSAVDGPENFEGHEGRECGDHRTTGGRAWCFDCSEWCYPQMPCARCELPKMRKLIADLKQWAENPLSTNGPERKGMNAAKKVVAQTIMASGVSA